MHHTAAISLVCGAADATPLLNSTTPAVKRRTGGKRATVLVVDDEKIIADTIAQVLGLSGFDALPVYSGRAALEQTLISSPDVVISDVVMPELNGIETAQRLLKASPSTKILLLSGQAAGAEMLKQARADGFNFELLAKPLHPEDLLAALRRIGF